MSTTDSIEKTVVLRAPHERVWRAVSDAQQFGAWFGVAFDAPFVAGAHLTARMVPTKADAEVAARQKAYEGMTFELTVDRIEPMTLISFRWHPFAIDKTVDYSAEPMTLIVFRFEEVSGGTKLTITETGFDKIPLARRGAAFAANQGGWDAQAQLLAKYLAS